MSSIDPLFFFRLSGKVEKIMFHFSLRLEHPRCGNCLNINYIDFFQSFQMKPKIHELEWMNFCCLLYIQRPNDCFQETLPLLVVLKGINLLNILSVHHFLHKDTLTILLIFY